MSSLSEIKSSSLREGAIRAIRAAIVFGEIRPGEIYSAPALAEQLGVSATPVREAMLELVSDGIVEAVRNRGFRVVPATQEDLDEILDLRMLIEVPLVSRAVGGLTVEDTERFRDLLATNAETARRGDLPEFFDQDRRFHLDLLKFAGNGRVVSLVGRLRDQARLYGGLSEVDTGHLIEWANEHQRIFDCIVAGDGERARGEMQAHLDHTRAVYSEYRASLAATASSGAPDRTSEPSPRGGIP